LASASSSKKINGIKLISSLSVGIQAIVCCLRSPSVYGEKRNNSRVRAMIPTPPTRKRCSDSSKDYLRLRRDFSK
jgi:hypothetical protein